MDHTPHMWLAIDPGIHTGWALFRPSDRILLHAGLGDPKHVGITHLIIEKPEIYRAAYMKGNPNDILTLAVRVGRYIERFESKGAHVTTVLPKEWKGQVPKDVHNNRVMAGLSEYDRGIADVHLEGVAKSHRNDVIDAIGLGVYAIKRGVWK